MVKETAMDSIAGKQVSSKTEHTSISKTSNTSKKVNMITGKGTVLLIQNRNEASTYTEMLAVRSRRHNMVFSYGKKPMPHKTHWLQGTWKTSVDDIIRAVYKIHQNFKIKYLIIDDLNSLENRQRASTNINLFCAQTLKRFKEFSDRQGITILIIFKMPVGDDSLPYRLKYWSYVFDKMYKKVNEKWITV